MTAGETALGNQMTLPGYCDHGMLAHLPCDDCKAARKQRVEDEDQPLPTHSESPAMHDLVCEDVLKRKALGLQRYGRALQAHNGRDVLRDIYEELLDASAYLRQAIYERDAAVMAAIKKRLTDPPKPVVCAWINNPDSSVYVAACGYVFDFRNDGELSVEGNKFAYCPNCGGKIVLLGADDDE